MNYFKRIFRWVSDSELTSLPFLTGNSRRFASIVCSTTLVLFASLVFIGAHGSALGLTDTFPETACRTSQYHYPSIGKARLCRYDEWISTQHVLSQCASDEFFPRINKNIAGGADMFMSTPSCPVWDWTAIGQFHNWGYFLLGEKRGFAWSWWSRFLGIVLFGFLVLRKHFRDDFLALTASIAMTLGAPTMWWDTTLPFELSYFFMALYGLRLLFQASSMILKTLGSLLFTVAFTSFWFSGYPIFELLLFPGFIILSCLEFKKSAADEPSGQFLAGRRLSWGLFAFSIAIVLFEFGYFLTVHADALEVIRHSAYPGGRIFRGGSMFDFLDHISLDIVSVIVPFLPDNYIPRHGLSHICEIARFFVPGLALFFCLVFLIKKKIKLPKVDIALFGFSLILLVWGMNQWPTFIAKITGFSNFSTHRTEPIASFFLMLSSFFIFSLLMHNDFQINRSVAAFGAMISVLLTLLFLILPEMNFYFFRSIERFLLLCLALSLAWTISYGLMRANRMLFCCSFFVLSLLSGLTVHPLSIGLSPVKDNLLGVLIKKVDGEAPGIWLANNAISGNFMATTGVKSIPGIQEYAYPNYWAKLDPEQKFRKEWDRYALCEFDIATNGVLSAEAVPVHRLRYSMTEENLRNLGITYLLWYGEPLDYPWLKCKGHISKQSIYTLFPKNNSVSGRIPSGK